jgi:serine/threonine-protein kinase
MDPVDSLREFVDGRIGMVLKSKWRLDSLIGIGGMAAVYAATHRNTKRVAVKMLHPDVSVDEGIRQRFLREGYAANRVGHPGAVEIFDDDVADDGSAFLVMELLDGENLDRRMRRKGGRLPQVEALSVAEQVLDTLAAAHERGIYHRDIKPENVFLTRGGIVKLLDFGIARVMELTGASKATQRGAILGTPAFMAPEQAMAIWEEVDGRSDIWALGATLFMLLTGDFVHPASTGVQALDYAVNKRARSVGSVNGGLHPSVVKLVDKSLAFEKSFRFQNAREMQEAVRAAYAELERAVRAPQLPLPDEETPPLPTHSVSSAPAPGYPSEPAPAAPVPAPVREAVPAPVVARTVLSKRKSQARLRTAIAVVVSAVALSFAVYLLNHARASSSQPVASSEPMAGSAGTPPPAIPAAMVSAAPQVVPSPSAAVAVPVLTPSALPIASSPASAPARPSSSARPRPTVTTTKPVATLQPVATPEAPPPATAAPPEPSPKPSAPADPFSGRF